MTKASKPQFGDPIGHTPNWKPHEAPMMPGSPSTPDFPLNVRLQYGLIGALIGITGSFGSALMSVNLPFVQGSLGLDPVEGGWIGAVYALAGIAMNLLLIKYRQQFGLSSFVRVFLGIYAAAALAQPFFAGYHSVLLVRAISGVTGAATTTFGVFYMFQAFPARFRLVSLCWNWFSAGWLPSCPSDLADPARSR